jgi:LPXTG-site transpeptidase (sortase) family protein
MSSVKIHTINFGNTPLYVAGSQISEGIIYPDIPFLRRMSENVFAVSVVALIFVLVFTSGKTYAARTAWALGSVRSIVSHYVLDGNLDRQNGMTPALLPLSEDYTKTPAEGAAALVNAEQLQGYSLIIPKLGVNAPVVKGDTASGNWKEGFENGVVLYPGSEQEGAGASAYILGHSSAPMGYKGDYGSVFALLDKLSAGDALEFNGPNGSAIYEVVQKAVIKPSGSLGPKSLNALASTDKNAETLVLLTCWPPGTSLQRIAVSARRVR